MQTHPLSDKEAKRKTQLSTLGLPLAFLLSRLCLTVDTRWIFLLVGRLRSASASSASSPASSRSDYHLIRFAETQLKSKKFSSLAQHCLVYSRSTTITSSMIITICLATNISGIALPHPSLRNLCLLCRSRCLFRSSPHLHSLADQQPLESKVIEVPRLLA